MDFYNNRWLLWFTKTETWAITIGNCTFYSTPEFIVSDRWRSHEECHKKQWRRYWYIGFLFLYLYELAVHGYSKNRFELEARIAERGK